MSQPAPPPAQITPAARATAWDRAAITALGSAGCGLSYDALQQMGAAIHIRGLLTYLFPLVIDGFIAYGVRALIILRTAPYFSRLYVWTLFGTATAASIWANALHAVRLNQQTSHAGLRLGDITVGVLSTLAPLALAGAVHLYILIARHTPRMPHESTEVPSTGCDRTDAEQCVTRPTSAETPDRPATRRYGRPPGADMSVLLNIARNAVAAHRKPSRALVRSAVRDAGLSVSEDRLTELMATLRTEAHSQSGDHPGPAR